MENFSINRIRSPNKEKPIFVTNVRPTYSPLKERTLLPQNGIVKGGHEKMTNYRINILSPQKQNTTQSTFSSKENHIPSMSSLQPLNSAQFQPRKNSFFQEQFNLNFNLKNNFNFKNQHSCSSIQKQFPSSNLQLKCQKCTLQKQSYLIVEDNLKYCSNCALEQMKKGKQIQSLKLTSPQIDSKVKRASSPETKIKIQSHNQINSSYYKPSHTIEQLSHKITQIQQALKSSLDNLSSQTKIHQKFNNHRQTLKKHYQKLKSIIQQAIKNDLQKLKKQQQKTILEFKHKNQVDLKKLKQLEDIKKLINKNKQNKQNEQFSIQKSFVEFSKEFQNYNSRSFMNKNSSNLEQLFARIQKISSNSENKNFLQNQLNQNFLNQKDFLYDSQIYRLTVPIKTILREYPPHKTTSCKEITNNGTIFSFQKLS